MYKRRMIFKHCHADDMNRDENHNSSCFGLYSVWYPCNDIHNMDWMVEAGMYYGRLIFHDHPYTEQT